jgi:GT2 family glycosyltransferase
MAYREQAMRVAVCITSHNRRGELARTLGEVATLHPLPNEILVVADGCTDDTVDFVRREYPTVRLIVHEQAWGSVASRNEMGFATDCDVFLSLDDDSYPVDYDAIAQIRELFAKNSRLAVAEFPQRTDERPESLKQVDFGPGRFIGSYANSGAAILREAFEDLGGYEDMFFHMYEEPDFALRCCAAGWQVRFEPGLHIRHHWTSSQRSEVRNHHRHARNEWWSVMMRCPMPWALAVAPFRGLRQLTYAFRRGWALREPLWWAQALLGLGTCVRRRQPLPWSKYRAWMSLVRKPHNDVERWERDFA